MARQVVITLSLPGAAVPFQLECIGWGNRDLHSDTITAAISAMDTSAADRMALFLRGDITDDGDNRFYLCDSIR